MYIPRRKSVVDCLYSTQFSPIAAFSSVYIDSKSRRGTAMSALVAFCVAGADVVTDLLVGTDEEEESFRLRAAGSICIVKRPGEEARGLREADRGAD